MKKKDAREQRFVREYLMDLNGTAAAERAGYTGTRASLATTAYRLLRNAEVQQLLTEARARSAAKTEVQEDEVLQVLLDHLRADLAELFDENGLPLKLQDMPTHVRRNIQAIEVDELFEDGEQIGRRHKVKLWSKDKALELALRHKGLLNDKLNLKTELTLEQLLRDALKPEGT